MWLARFVAILVVKVLRKRPTEEKNKDTFCFSFFIDEKHLNIKDVMVSQQGQISYPYWLEQFLPIYNLDNTYEKFLAANRWYKDYLPNGIANQFIWEVKDSIWSKFIKMILRFIFCPPILHHWTDGFFRNFQTKIIDHNLRELVNIDSRIVINEKMLKFHVNDPRESVAKKWRDKVYELLGKYESAEKL